VIEELRKRKIDVITLPFDGPISHGGGPTAARTHPLLLKDAGLKIRHPDRSRA